MRYEVVSVADAKAKGLPGSEDIEDKDDCRSILYRIDDGGVYHYFHCDGGEPEDNWFFRDWSWVPDELNKLAAMIPVESKDKNPEHEKPL